MNNRRSLPSKVTNLLRILPPKWKFQYFKFLIRVQTAKPFISQENPRYVADLGPIAALPLPMHGMRAEKAASLVRWHRNPVFLYHIAKAKRPVDDTCPNHRATCCESVNVSLRRVFRKTFTFSEIQYWYLSIFIRPTKRALAASIRQTISRRSSEEMWIAFAFSFRLKREFKWDPKINRRTQVVVNLLKSTDPLIGTYTKFRVFNAFFTSNRSTIHQTHSYPDKQYLDHHHLLLQTQTQTSPP